MVKGNALTAFTTRDVLLCLDIPTLLHGHDINCYLSVLDCYLCKMDWIGWICLCVCWFCIASRAPLRLKNQNLKNTNTCEVNGQRISSDYSRTYPQEQTFGSSRIRKYVDQVEDETHAWCTNRQNDSYMDQKACAITHTNWGTSQDRRTRHRGSLGEFPRA